MSCSLAERNYVLAWTSLWIYVPALCWALHDTPSISYWCISLLPISGTLSIAHWSYNSANSWLHILDIAMAIMLALQLSYQLLIARKYIIWLTLFGGFIIAFVMQRLQQMRDEINWNTTTLLHLIFRYFGFWLAMAVHLPADLSYISWIITIVSLTWLYVLHIMWLTTQVKNMQSCYITNSVVSLETTCDLR